MHQTVLLTSNAPALLIPCQEPEPSSTEGSVWVWKHMGNRVFHIEVAAGGWRKKVGMTTKMSWERGGLKSPRGTDTQQCFQETF